MKLSELSCGCSARILHVGLTGPVRQRMLDFGMIEHTLITCLQTAPGGNPSAYLIRGTVIAIRNADAEKIELYPIK